MAFDVKDAKAFLAEVVVPAIYPERVPLHVTARHLPGEPQGAAEAVAGPFTPFRVGDRWGGMWGTTWFRCRATTPDAWEGRAVAAVVHLGGARSVGFSAEGLIWSSDLTPIHGLHHEHREYLISDRGVAGQAHDFYIEAAANPIPRWHVKDWPRLEPDYLGHELYALEQADLALVDEEIKGLGLDLEVVLDLAVWVESRRDEAAAAFEEAMGLVVAGGPDSCARARETLRPVLTRANQRPVHTISAVGHAHIDTAWLWPVRETRRKCARTFANQLMILDRYPEHHFVCSQAAQYQWIKDGYPQIYDAIRARVAEGRWEPVGGMWVEPDTNVPSGESLVRQFVHGKRFFAEEFGVETHEMWIPDVFGYSAALPQIAAGVGVTALITQKMSWNDTNRFPHSTFWWEGHDGTRILAHFPPAATYNGVVIVPELVNDERNFIDKDRSDHTLYPFGWGDGGGGPTTRQVESARRLADVDGLPRLEIGTVAGFLDRLRQEDAPLETWVGELYLEAHRATSTTHADVKWGNRRGEEALRAAEMWSVAAGRDVAEQLDPLWKRLLVNQFHDILPGSSIAWVYRDAAIEHAEVLDGAGRVIAAAQDAIAPSDPSDLVAFNPSSYERDELIELPGGEQCRIRVPGCGWAPAVGVPVADDVESGDGWIDNGLLRVAYDHRGVLTSIWDHDADREVLAAGQCGNLFQLHEDHPKAFDAWDVDREYFDDVVDLDDRAEVETVGAGRIRFSRSFGSSVITQEMRLVPGSGRIEFHTEVDWQERHRFLKVAFPVAVRSQTASYEIQHGHIERPTHANTSWDAARFEVCGHRWADLSEPGYGVALLNDGKYGYDVRGHTLRLSLLRGPGYPDPDADRGRHRFAYALYPHRGDLRDGRVVEEAEAFNLPITVRPGRVAAPGCIVEVDRPGVSIEAVKGTDRFFSPGPGTVVRLCEVHGSRGPATVTLHRPFRQVERTDLLERDGRPLEHQGKSVRLQLRPFELVTLKFT
ncbi:MAG TPA: glycoside hydrolase family 38 C-terminal domain-containing protein [Acidimicrobiales bacterium]|jgi:alpha-mannosidase|nr:glycoside hydrolase family 38 C-terminal domain-containing protein [Acidimicrobiales bacterium]